MSLANNDFRTLSQLSKLAHALPYIRALDLSNNPFTHFSELDHLLASAEKKGKASSGIGSLKSLIELKLNDCPVREQTLTKRGDDAYQQYVTCRELFCNTVTEEFCSEILRRFPGLRILDGVHLNRIVFALEREPKIQHDPAARTAFASKPFSFPVDVQSNFAENEMINGVVMGFCQK